MIKTATLTTLLLLTIHGIEAAEPAQTRSSVDPEIVKTCVDKSLKLIQFSSGESLQHRKCFTCHHQAIPILVCAAAQSHGIAIDAKNLRQQLKRTRDHLASGRENYLQGKGQGGKADTAGYALWALEAGGKKPDDVTQPVASYLLNWQKESEHWKCTSDRPPSEASNFTTSYLAVRGLRAYGDAPQSEPAVQRLKQVQKWLQTAKPVDNEDRVFGLRALHYLAAADEAVRTAGQALLEQQRPDGGWAQTSELSSDAYATGTSLSALHSAGLLNAGSDAYQRGLRFLIDAQQDDGSWHVKSRSRPFQTYYETGFPHGKDQFISMMATGWSTIALIHAYPAASSQP
jgi:N-acyl-D-amino-acid deacylase